MKEIGILNRAIAKIISEQGHGDLLMVCDAGFAIPKGIEVVDLALAPNKPMVMEMLTELKQYFSVEKMILANQTKETNPTLFKDVAGSFGEGIEVEMIDHTELKQKSHEVKAVIRTGDFTAYGNVILVSGAGERWYCEK
ncbi:D-ribose pyranase [Marinifilum sp.]|uniref:D-ribose pyranase n=1 Tax=Marinifilum sp. TaxID=2033137 RepID=UPI003BAA7D62